MVPNRATRIHEATPRQRGRLFYFRLRNRGLWITCGESTFINARPRSMPRADRLLWRASQFRLMSCLTLQQVQPLGENACLDTSPCGARLRLNPLRATLQSDIRPFGPWQACVKTLGFTIRLKRPVCLPGAADFQWVVCLDPHRYRRLWAGRPFRFGILRQLQAFLNCRSSRYVSLPVVCDFTMGFVVSCHFFFTSRPGNFQHSIACLRLGGESPFAPFCGTVASSIE
jgi:hypothetical protein